MNTLDSSAYREVLPGHIVGACQLYAGWYLHEAAHGER